MFEHRDGIAMAIAVHQQCSHAAQCLGILLFSFRRFAYHNIGSLGDVFGCKMMG